MSENSPGVRRLEHRYAVSAAASLLCGLSVWPTQLSAQTWVNPGSGNWFTAGNWAPAAVPAAGGIVIVTNGGTATLTGVPTTPVLSNLVIGLAGSGTGVGAVTSNGVNVLATSLYIGAGLGGAGGSANGVLQITGGAGGVAGTLAVGVSGMTALGSNVSGRLDAEGSFDVRGGRLFVGETFGDARGSVAIGVANIGGNVSRVGTLVVGETVSLNNDQVGSRVSGVLNIGGTVTILDVASVGTTFSPDRVADAAAAGGFRVNQSSGTANIGGTLLIADTTTSLSIGTTGGGVVDGAMSVGALNQAVGNFLSLAVGNSSARGQASGSFSAGSGDLQVGNGLSVGTTFGGTAQGSVTLGGALLGRNDGALNVGVVNGNSFGLAQAGGTVNAAAGVSNFTSYNVGTVNGAQAAGSFAQGSVIGGAAAPASIAAQVFVGFNFAGVGGGATMANGILTLGNTLNINNGPLTVGQNFGAARGSVANGQVNIAGNAGTANFFIVGDTFSFDNDQVGSRATGVVNIGGNLTVTGFATVGTTPAPDRVADGAAPGGFRFNQSSGAVVVGGTLSFANSATSLLIGTTGGGVVEGTLSAGVLNQSAGNFLSVAVGNSSARGQASGSFSAGSGDLRAGGDVNVGTTSAGTAQGSLTLVGALLGNDSGLLRVGTVLNPSSTVPGSSAYQGVASVSAAGGISGYTGYDIAAITGPQAAGSRAQASVIGGAGAPTSNVTRFVNVGVVNSTGNAASANGSLILGNSLNILNRDFIAGSASAVAGSTATGAASITGNVGTVRDLLVGQSVAFSADQVGSLASGTVEIGGNMSLTRFLLAGYTFADGFTSLDRVADAAAPGGFRFNQASGTIKVGGTLSITNTATSWFIGTTSGGIVDGSVRAGSIAMGGNTLQRVDVGVSGAQGQATGTLEIHGGYLRADTVRLGATTGGAASGGLALDGANLSAINVQAGTGGGIAQMLLLDSQSAVLQDMSLLSGRLGLERSTLGVGRALTFGFNTLLHVEIDGLLRGNQYGTIDAGHALLDGLAEFDFGDLIFSGANAVFDILRSGSASGIDGNFNAFSFVNLPSGYSATAGIETDAGVEVYRVRLARNAATVPVAGTLWLMLLGLGVLVTLAQRRRCSYKQFVPSIILRIKPPRGRTGSNGR